MNRGRYLAGDCMLLAVAVWRLTGWPLVEMTDPYHVLIRCPDGRLLDAAGPHEPGCLAGIPHRDAAGAELAAWFGCRAAAPDVAADAGELLAMYGLDGGASSGELLVLPLPWRPRARSVPSAADLQNCGLLPLS